MIKLYLFLVLLLTILSCKPSIDLEKTNYHSLYNHKGISKIQFSHYFLHGDFLFFGKVKHFYLEEMNYDSKRLIKKENHYFDKNKNEILYSRFDYQCNCWIYNEYYGFKHEILFKNRYKIIGVDTIRLITTLLNIKEKFIVTKNIKTLEIDTLWYENNFYPLLRLKYNNEGNLARITKWKFKDDVLVKNIHLNYGNGFGYYFKYDEQQRLIGSFYIESLEQFDSLYSSEQIEDKLNVKYRWNNNSFINKENKFHRGHSFDFEKKRYIHRNKTDSTVYDFDSNLKLVKKTTLGYTPNNGLQTTYEYNEFDLIKETALAPNGKKSVYSYNYEYDKYNNWIKREILYNGKPQKVTTRKIAYY